MRVLIPVILFLGILNGTGCSQASFKGRGNRAPDVFLKALSEDRPGTSLSELYQEAPVLLVFWASWCPSCVEEISVLNEWHNTWAPQGLKILGINVQESREEVLKFKAKRTIEYPIVLDEEGEVAGAFGLAGLPSSVFLAKGGEILYYGFSLPPNIEQLLTNQSLPARQN